MGRECCHIYFSISPAPAGTVEFPLAVVSYTRKNPPPIYNFSWIGLNERVKKAAPKDYMWFRWELHRLLDCALESDPVLVTAFLRKVDLSDS